MLRHDNFFSAINASGKLPATLYKLLAAKAQETSPGLMIRHDKFSLL